jgi:hypothetical protein
MLLGTVASSHLITPLNTPCHTHMRTTYRITEISSVVLLDFEVEDLLVDSMIRGTMFKKNITN